MTGIALDEVLNMLRERRSRLPFEIGAFVALQFLDETLAGPRYARPRDLFLRDDGVLDVERATACDERDAIVSVHGLLAALLAASGEGVPPMLADLVARSPQDLAPSLARLRDELEAALVPLNREASRRVLARTLRDLRRAPTTASGRKDDDALDAFLDGRPDERGPDVVIRSHELERAPVSAPKGDAKASIFRDDGGEDDVERSSSMAIPMVVGVLVVLALLAGLYFLTRATDAPSRTPAPASAPPSAPRRPAFGELEVIARPEGAVVRLFVGTMPTVVDEVPVGVAQELVSLAQNGDAVRALVPSDAAYRDVDGLPELAVELSDAPRSGAQILPTTALVAGSMGAPSGTLGRLRVGGVAGGRLYRTVGFAPLARIAPVRTSRSLELLVAAPGHVAQRLVVEPASFVAEGEVRRARVEVTLRPETAP